MTIFAFVLQLIFLLFLLSFLVFFVTQLYNIIFRGFAPLVSTSKKIIEKIIANLEIDENMVVYELGCGRAAFLRALRRKYPKIKLVGIEYSFWPYIDARIQNTLSNSQIKIIKDNFYHARLNEADVIYCYLNRGTMEALNVKFGRECKRGTIIVSYQFRLPDRDPEKVLEMNNSRDKIYFYRI